MQQIHLTEHAATRLNQRGITRHQLAGLLRYADLEARVGRSLTVHRLSREAEIRAREDGMAPTLLERLRGRAVVIADDGVVVTVAHICGRNAKTYRRRDRRAYWIGGRR